MSKRRTLLAGDIPRLHFETDVIDDDAEKRRRVSERFDVTAMSGQRRLQQSRLAGEGDRTSVSNKTSNNTTVSSAQAAPKPSNEQLSCLYNNCVKLLNENKINVKNAFQLKLIDYMSDIVLNTEISGGVTNFQVVGCTIDVGSKIYAARVDALHQNTYQVLSGLNHQSAEDEAQSSETQNDLEDEANENLGDENDGESSGKKNKAAKKRRLKKSSHIVTNENIDSITLKMRDEFKDEDLYFAKKSTCIENEAIGGILLNKLHIQNDSLKMLINSEDQQYGPSGENNHVNKECEMNFRGIFDSYTAHSYDLKNLKLCADLTSFKFIDYQMDENNDMSKLVESFHQQEEEGLEVHRFDANNLQMSRLDVSAPISGDIDIEECCNDFDNDVENMDIDPNSNVPKLAQHLSGLDLLDIDDIRAMNSISDLSTLISHTPSDYSYFNFDKLKMVNLPKNLKQIADHMTSERGSSAETRNTVVQKNARTTKKMAPRIEFNKQLDQTKIFKVTKKAIYLCDRTIEKRSEKPCRLETERQFNYESRDLFRPYNKKITAKIVSDVNDSVENLLNADDAIRMGHKSNPENIPNARNMDDDDDHIGGIDDGFEIPGTAQTNEPFFSQHGGEFIQSQQIDIMNPMNEMELMQQDDLGNMSRFDGENLIQAPIQVNALNIEYAKTSKNIDARRLKQIIWSLLCNSDKENINTTTSESENSILKQKSSVEVNASLKAVYKKLVPPLVSQRVYDDLSSCIVFQMVLFLANEHNLLLKHELDGSDVQITNY